MRRGGAGRGWIFALLSVARAQTAAAAQGDAALPYTIWVLIVAASAWGVGLVALLMDKPRPRTYLGEQSVESRASVHEAWSFDASCHSLLAAAVYSRSRWDSVRACAYWFVTLLLQVSLLRLYWMSNAETWRGHDASPYADSPPPPPPSAPQSGAAALDAISFDGGVLALWTSAVFGAYILLYLGNDAFNGLLLVLLHARVARLTARRPEEAGPHSYGGASSARVIARVNGKDGGLTAPAEPPSWPVLSFLCVASYTQVSSSLMIAAAAANVVWEVAIMDGGSRHVPTIMFHFVSLVFISQLDDIVLASKLLVPVAPRLAPTITLTSPRSADHPTISGRTEPDPTKPFPGSTRRHRLQRVALIALLLLTHLLYVSYVDAAHFVGISDVANVAKGVGIGGGGGLLVFAACALTLPRRAVEGLACVPSLLLCIGLYVLTEHFMREPSGPHRVGGYTAEWSQSVPWLLRTFAHVLFLFLLLAQTEYPDEVGGLLPIAAGGQQRRGWVITCGTCGELVYAPHANEDARSAAGGGGCEARRLSILTLAFFCNHFSGALLPTDAISDAVLGLMARLARGFEARPMEARWRVDDHWLVAAAYFVAFFLVAAVVGLAVSRLHRWMSAVPPHGDVPRVPDNAAAFGTFTLLLGIASAVCAVSRTLQKEGEELGAAAIAAQGGDFWRAEELYANGADNALVPFLLVVLLAFGVDTIRSAGPEGPLALDDLDDVRLELEGAQEGAQGPDGALESLGGAEAVVSRLCELERARKALEAEGRRVGAELAELHRALRERRNEGSVAPRSTVGAEESAVSDVGPLPGEGSADRKRHSLNQSPHEQSDRLASFLASNRAARESLPKGVGGIARRSLLPWKVEKPAAAEAGTKGPKPGASVLHSVRESVGGRLSASEAAAAEQEGPHQPAPPVRWESSFAAPSTDGQLGARSSGCEGREAARGGATPAKAKPQPSPRPAAQPGLSTPPRASAAAGGRVSFTLGWTPGSQAGGGGVAESSLGGLARQSLPDPPSAQPSYFASASERKRGTLDFVSGVELGGERSRSPVPSARPSQEEELTGSSEEDGPRDSSSRRMLGDGAGRASSRPQVSGRVRTSVSEFESRAPAAAYCPPASSPAGCPASGRGGGAACGGCGCEPPAKRPPFAAAAAPGAPPRGSQGSEGLDGCGANSLSLSSAELGYGPEAGVPRLGALGRASRAASVLRASLEAQRSRGKDLGKEGKELGKGRGGSSPESSWSSRSYSGIRRKKAEAAAEAAAGQGASARQSLTHCNVSAEVSAAREQALAQAQAEIASACARVSRATIALGCGASASRGPPSPSRSSTPGSAAAAPGRLQVRRRRRRHHSAPPEPGGTATPGRASPLARRSLLTDAQLSGEGSGGGWL